MECPFCRKTNINSGFIRGGYRTYFFSDEEIGKVFKTPIPIKAYLCKDCGMLFFKEESK